MQGRIIIVYSTCIVFILTALLTVDGFMPVAWRNNRVTMTTTSSLAASTLPGLGGDYANMRGPSLPPPKDGSVFYGPLKGIGGDYANVQGVAVEMRMPPVVAGNTNEQLQQATTTTSPAVVQEQYEDVAIAMEQPQVQNLTPPPPLRGIGGDYDVMYTKVSMMSSDDDEEHKSRTAIAPQVGSSSNQQEQQVSSFGPLRGIGGDYANVQGVPREF